VAAADGTEAGEAWRQPSPKLLQLRRVEVAAVTLLLAAGAGVAASFAGLAWGLLSAGAALALGLLSEPFVARRVRSWGYAERDDDLLVRRGLLFRRLSVVPYGRMQFIDVSAGPLERSFRLATVRMHTAAAASDARVPGLELAEAARLRDRLARRGEALEAGI
jgi:membrane protein YdbS with pleckstrin-like domain